MSSKAKIFHGIPSPRAFKLVQPQYVYVLDFTNCLLENFSDGGKWAKPALNDELRLQCKIKQSTERKWKSVNGKITEVIDDGERLFRNNCIQLLKYEPIEYEDRIEYIDPNGLFRRIAHINYLDKSYAIVAYEFGVYFILFL